MRYHELTERLLGLEPKDIDSEVRGWLGARAKELAEGDIAVEEWNRTRLGLTEPRTEKETKHYCCEGGTIYCYCKCHVAPQGTPKPKEWPCEHMDHVERVYFGYSKNPLENLAERTDITMCPVCGTRKPEPVDRDTELLNAIAAIGRREDWVTGEDLAKLVLAHFKESGWHKD